MNIQDLQTKLRTIPQLKDFVWTEDNYGTMEVGTKTFKDSGKNEYKLGNQYSIFLAHMYEGQPTKEFFYIIMARSSECRGFRKHSFYTIEFNKRFISGNSVEIVFAKFNELFTNTRNPYEFL